VKITKRQLRRIIRESLPYGKGQPWVDPEAPVGTSRPSDRLDRELTDKEIEASMGWERADPAGDDEFWSGYGDATKGLDMPHDASETYQAGWEDGNRQRVTESKKKKIKESANKLRKWAEGWGFKLILIP